jgi:hypothetical protein
VERSVENFLSVYLIVFAIALTAAVLQAMRSNRSISQKWAKVRIRADEQRQKGLPDHPEEEYEPAFSLEWLFWGFIFLVICMLLSRM